MEKYLMFVFLLLLVTPIAEGTTSGIIESLKNWKCVLRKENGKDAYCCTNPAHIMCYIGIGNKDLCDRACNRLGWSID
ncbi:unnamed protein product [Lactuca virosa]|uniref:Uncharacterized protein n=1 Tax=Lactuca virosa TaxID=75947 RepID=A0AAU9N5G9_9ASTR|nr:unnamed protein product [Lactuca virosa]